MIAANSPIQSGPYPRRWRARNPRAPALTARNPAVTGSRYVVPIRKLRPSDDTIPAYAGQHTGQINFGRRETPTPGIVKSECFQIDLIISRAPRRGSQGLGTRPLDH